MGKTFITGESCLNNVQVTAIRSVQKIIKDEVSRILCDIISLL